MLTLCSTSIARGELVTEEITADRRPMKDDQDERSKRANQYTDDTVRPSAHIAVHILIINEEYALVNNVDTPEGEDFHR
ncbi:hypothetical protein UCDDA912_g07771 [Diaporthe ampelina]|uniref:Uncharacterized protein n=1 Tax=Diaporthe ampelina TaxID=1214573 RepID=A0A0G2HW24_9PEZI|nr:hypothetical protein UCDDA912_g07771 [Diaporthe ampelina]